MEQKISLEQILNEAIAYWRAVMKYNLLFSLIYFSLFMVMTYGLANYLGLWEKFAQLQPVTDMEKYYQQIQALAQSQEVVLFSSLIVLCSGLIFPLHIGFFKIFRKIDNKENPEISDLFEGYKGVNFFKFSSYSIMWKMIYNFMYSLIIPAPFWIMLTLFVTPLMYFKNEPLGTALVWNFHLLKRNFLIMFICVLATAIISYSGVLLFFVGYALTFPFWNAMIYTLYKHMFKENTENQ